MPIVLITERHSIHASLYSDASLMIDSSGVGTSVRAFSPRRHPPTLVPASQSTLQTRMKYLHEQLDCFAPSQPLLGLYMLLGCGERRCRGVLPAQGCALPQCQLSYALLLEHAGWGKGRG